MKCIIFGGADIKKYKPAGHYAASLYAAADRGILHCRALDIVPDVVLGDFDSCSYEDMLDYLKSKGAEVDFDNVTANPYSAGQAVISEGDNVQQIELLKAPAEKDDTDTMLAVKYVLTEYECDSFELYGCSGGRLGHTMANIQTLSYLAGAGCEAVMYGDEYDIRVQREGTVHYSDIYYEYEYISVFALSETAHVYMTGLKYGGDVRLERAFPLGVSNEIAEGGNTFDITVKSGEILVICEKSNKS